MPPLIESYYKRWLAGADLIEHPKDIERFYQFVKAYVAFWRRSYELDLGKCLDQDLKERFPNPDVRSKTVWKLDVLFDHLVAFSRGRFLFPDPYIGPTSRALLSLHLSSFIDGAGKPAYTREQIENELDARFGKT